ncbi:MAG TPA: multifunctional CCA tRNA nucleotidyl transferase/2'3'-cyclic phosphodiesterase/2'nucleotidase/phosphatase [Steroidobacteraceae bacterium]
MQVYLVGGAVRDELLGLPVRERDWVVVGATPDEMLQAGYQPVGQDFPVYLHPKTREEYALARLERKVGPGYRGFVTEFSPTVTLDEDLLRRDLTINAMARTPEGKLIDPYGGERDLRACVLRHVSEAFGEDPVRVLRVARFAARFAALGFVVAPPTVTLMRQLVASGEMAALVAERIWRELERALGEPRPERFFETLALCGALPIVLPELASMWPSAGPANEAARRLKAAAALSAEGAVRLAALTAPLAPAPIEALAARLRLPTEYSDLCVLAARLGDAVGRADQLDAEGLLKLLEAADALRRPERLSRLVLAAEALAGSGAALWPPGDALRRAFKCIAAVSVSSAGLTALAGPELGQALRAARLAALTKAGADPAP